MAGRRRSRMATCARTISRNSCTVTEAASSLKTHGTRSPDRATPILRGARRHGPGAGTGADVLEQATLKGPRLRSQTERRKALHDAGEPQVIVIARLQPDARAKRETRLVDLDAASIPAQAVEHQHPIQRPAEPIPKRRVAGEGLDGRVRDERRQRVRRLADASEIPTGCSRAPLRAARRPTP